MKQPHKTEDGWCCACDYDKAVFQGKIEDFLKQFGSLPPIDDWTAGYHAALSDMREQLL